MVAGMVRNEGEPGGGPFWLEDDEGVLRAQIVESSEMNAQDSVVRAVMASATHFNPVDLVCALTGPDKVPYDLSQFVDRQPRFPGVQKSRPASRFTGWNIRVCGTAAWADGIRCSWRWTRPDVCPGQDGV